MDSWVKGSWLPNGEPNLEPMKKVDHVWVFVNAGKWSKPHATPDPYFYLSTHKHAEKLHNNGEAYKLRWWWMPVSVPSKPEDC
jgi:hypothetical protein